VALLGFQQASDMASLAAEAAAAEEGGGGQVTPLATLLWPAVLAAASPVGLAALLLTPRKWSPSRRLALLGVALVAAPAVTAGVLAVLWWVAQEAAAVANGGG
jgi:hypothetical protein